MTTILSQTAATSETTAPTFSCAKNLFVPCLDCAAGTVNHEAHGECCKDRTTEDYPNAYTPMICVLEGDAWSADEPCSACGGIVTEFMNGFQQCRCNGAFAARVIAEAEAAQSSCSLPDGVEDPFAEDVAPTFPLTGSKSCEIVGDLFSAADAFAGSVHFPSDLPAYVTNDAPKPTFLKSGAMVISVELCGVEFTYESSNGDDTLAEFIYKAMNVSENVFASVTNPAVYVYCMNTKPYKWNRKQYGKAKQGSFTAYNNTSVTYEDLDNPEFKFPALLEVD